MFSEAVAPREMLAGMWIDKAGPWEGLRIKKSGNQLPINRSQKFDHRIVWLVGI